MAAIILNKTAFLNAPITVESLHGVTFSNESKGHKFVISCMQDGELINLTGSVSARFIRANGTTILLASGEYGDIVDGKAVVTLHQDCYNVPGRFQLAIFNTVGQTTTCIYACVGTVQRTQTETIIDSGEVIPDISELLAQIEACEDATDAANTAADAANVAAVAGDNKFVRYDAAQTLTDAQKNTARTNTNSALADSVAPLFDATQAYNAGTYVRYTDGNLYKITAWHTANVTWANTQKTLVNVGSALVQTLNDAGSVAQLFAEGTRAYIAPNFSNAAAYSAGDYVIYNAQMWRFNTNHAAGDWNASEVTAVVVGSEVSNLKSAFEDVTGDIVTLNVSKNLMNFDDPDYSAGHYINPSNGSSVSSSSYNASGFIPVEAGKTYHLAYGNDINTYRSMRFIAAYDSNKTVKSSAGANSVTSYTVPNGIAYIRISAASQYFKPTGDNEMVYEGSSIDAYYPYYEPYYIVKQSALDIDYIREQIVPNIALKDIKNNFGCALPSQYRFRMTVGLPETWYYKNCVTPPTAQISIGVGAEYGRYAEKGKYFPNETALSSKNGYKWTMMDELLVKVSEYKGSAGYGGVRRIIAENLSNCSALVIGDSTVDFDTMTQDMLDYFTTKNKTLTLLGTLGSENNRNEGRAGWKAIDYLTNKTYKGVVNPFYNPTSETFDFSYYMTNQGYLAPDFVILQLGINDLYNGGLSDIEPTWNAIKTMIDSILNYNDGIHILLNLITAPNSDPAQHPTIFLPLYQNRVVRYNEYAIAQASALYGASKVRPTYCHLILDPDTDIRDNVHPTNAGFEKMAKEVINQINCWQNGE